MGGRWCVKSRARPRHAGDGTTTATVLAQAIYREGAKTSPPGANPMDNQARHREGGRGAHRRDQGDVEAGQRNMVAQVGTISANNDETIGKIHRRAMDKVGKDGVITVEEAARSTLARGRRRLQFDAAYLSPYFVTDPERMEVVLENPVIRSTKRRSARMKDLLPVLEQVARLGRPLLIIAEDIEGAALATLVVKQAAAARCRPPRSKAPWLRRSPARRCSRTSPP